MIDGLIESIRFGFSSLGSPLAPLGDGSAEQKTQAGIPPGGIRFGFRPRGNASSAVSLGPVQPQYQSGFPPNALRFGPKPTAGSPPSPGTGAGVPHFQSGIPPNLLRFGFRPIGQGADVSPDNTPPRVPRPEVPSQGAGAPPVPLHRRKKNWINYPVRDADLREEQVTPEVPQTTAEPQVEPPKKGPRLDETGPLPILADFGAGPVTIGLKVPSLTEQMNNALLADDEEALIAILLAAAQD